MLSGLGHLAFRAVTVLVRAAIFGGALNGVTQRADVPCHDPNFDALLGLR